MADEWPRDDEVPPQSSLMFNVPSSGELMFVGIDPEHPEYG